MFLVYSLLLGFKFEPILAQILENLTNLILAQILQIVPTLCGQKHP